MDWQHMCDPDPTMKTIRIPIIRLLLLGALFAVAPACNTMSGVGRDVETAGEEIQDAAR